MNENENVRIDPESAYVKSIPGISAKARAKNLNYRVVYSFVTLLYIYDTVIPNGKAKIKRNAEIRPESATAAIVSFISADSPLVFFKSQQLLLTNLYVHIKVP